MVGAVSHGIDHNREQRSLREITMEDTSRCCSTGISLTVQAPKADHSRLGGKVVAEIMVWLTDSFVTAESASQVRYVYKIADDTGNSQLNVTPSSYDRLPRFSLPVCTRRRCGRLRSKRGRRCTGALRVGTDSRHNIFRTRNSLQAARIGRRRCGLGPV